MSEERFHTASIDDDIPNLSKVTLDKKSRSQSMHEAFTVQTSQWTRQMVAIETQNTQLEQMLRATMMSLNDLEIKHNALLEKVALLEQDAIARQGLEDNLARLQTQLNDAHLHIDVLEKQMGLVRARRQGPENTPWPETPINVSRPSSDIPATILSKPPPREPLNRALSRPPPLSVSKSSIENPLSVSKQSSIEQPLSVSKQSSIESTAALEDDLLDTPAPIQITSDFDDDLLTTEILIPQPPRRSSLNSKKRTSLTKPEITLTVPRVTTDRPASPMPASPVMTAKSMLDKVKSLQRKAILKVASLEDLESAATLLTPIPASPFPTTPTQKVIHSPMPSPNPSAPFKDTTIKVEAPKSILTGSSRNELSHSQSSSSERRLSRVSFDITPDPTLMQDPIPPTKREPSKPKGKHITSSRKISSSYRSEGEKLVHNPGLNVLTWSPGSDKAKKQVVAAKITSPAELIVSSKHPQLILTDTPYQEEKEPQGTSLTELANIKSSWSTPSNSTSTTHSTSNVRESSLDRNKVAEYVPRSQFTTERLNPINWQPLLRQSDPPRSPRSGRTEAIKVDGVTVSRIKEAF